MKIIVFRVVSAILLISLFVLIFSFSAQTASESSSVSEGFSYKLFSVIYPGFLNFDVARQNEILSDFSFIIRKLAHFSLYFFMGIISFFTFISYKKFKLGIRIGTSYVVCVLYSISDEIHQYFIPGRSCELRDVLIDISGAFLSILLLLIICIYVKKIKNRVV